MADFAFITPDAPFFSRAVRQGAPRYWQYGGRSFNMLRLHCRPGEKVLRLALRRALHSGCLVAALPPSLCQGLAYSPLPLADGRMLSLSMLPARLDKETPDWRRQTLCFNADDDYECLAARWLAPHCARLYISGQNEGQRSALTHLLYKESGLITLSGPQPPALGVFYWQRQQKAEAPLNEALLLAAGGLPRVGDPLDLLRLLYHRTCYYRVLPL